jgi:hypothetical protein
LHLWKFAAADVAAPLPKGNRASHRKPGFERLFGSATGSTSCP